MQPGAPAALVPNQHQRPGKGGEEHEKINGEAESYNHLLIFYGEKDNPWTKTTTAARRLRPKSSYKDRYFCYCCWWTRLAREEEGILVMHISILSENFHDYHFN